MITLLFPVFRLYWLLFLLTGVRASRAARGPTLTFTTLALRAGAIHLLSHLVRQTTEMIVLFLHFIEVILFDGLFASFIALSSSVLTGADTLSPFSFNSFSVPVAEIVEVVLHRDALAFLLVLIRVHLGVFHHFLNVCLAKATARSDLDRLLFARGHIFCRNVNNAIRIDIKTYLDLRTLSGQQGVQYAEIAPVYDCHTPFRARLAARESPRLSESPPPSRKSGSCESGSSYYAQSAW